MGIAATSLTNRLTKPFVRLLLFQKFPKCTKIQQVSPRTQRGFAATNSRLYYDHVPLVINSGYAQNSRGLATCEPLRCGSAATNSLSYYNHVPLVINSGYAQNSGGPPLSGRPLQNRSQAINGNNVYRLKKYTTNGLVRRGRPEQGGPLERFNHSLFLPIGKLL